MQAWQESMLGGDCSVTRLGDLLDFGHVFKAFGNNNLPKSPTYLCNFYKVVILLVKSFLATSIDIWRFFSGHTGESKTFTASNIPNIIALWSSCCPENPKHTQATKIPRQVPI